MRPTGTRLATATAIFLLAVGSLVPSAAAVGETRRISVTSDGGQANGDTPARTVPDTTSPATSLDGRWVAFSSDATNLVRRDRNGVADVFLRDLATGRTTRASLTRSGAEADGPSYSPSLSVDGRFLAFVSSASNLVPGDDNGVADVFVLDRTRGKLRRISTGWDGSEANGPSNTPFVSLFGDWVTFESGATNLVRKNDDNGRPDAFVWVRTRNRIRRLATPHPRPGNDDLVRWTIRPTISYDGRYAAVLRVVQRARPGPDTGALPDVTTPAPPSVPGTPLDGVHLPPSMPDDPFMSDVFIIDRKKKRARRVHVPPKDGRFRVLADEPQLSADGRRVVFTSWSVLDPASIATAPDLFPNPGLPDEPGVKNPFDRKVIYLYDHLADALVFVSKNLDGLAPNGDSTQPQISSEGHAMAFISEASNLVPADDNGVADVFVWDTRERTVSRVSVANDASDANGASLAMSMSYDARHVVFSSSANDLVDDDTNARIDVFHHDRRIDVPNRTPNLRPIRKVRAIDVLAEHRSTLRATDPDGDPMRFDVIIAVQLNGSDPTPGTAEGLTVHPDTGEVRWTPTPDQAGAWVIVFWVEDPRGASDLEVARYVVRTIPETANCTIENSC